ncbi:MAG: sigma-70 family RNA polymerase sigma factor [Planctomycetes bacterium]|nr:sigma-70 family RNA polymerase sigma factor [Planctomycetota bacterium]
MERDVSRTTILLRRLRGGDAGASDELLPIVLQELHKLAQVVMHDERRNHTLQPTALLNEAWIRLVGPGGSQPWEDRAHFLRLAARAMRQVLVDHARTKNAQKRGGGAKPIDAEELLESTPVDPAELLDIHEALEALAREDAEVAQIVELRYFGGLSLEETASVMGRTIRQVHRSWTFARGWLRRRIESGRGDAEAPQK